MWLHLVVVFAVRGLAAAVDTALHRPAASFRSLAIDPNLASIAELALLPGVGFTRAQAIVLERVRHGPFRDLSALARVPGLGPVTIERLRPHLCGLPPDAAR